MDPKPLQAPASTCTQVSFRVKHFATIGAESLTSAHTSCDLETCGIARKIGIFGGWMARPCAARALRAGTKAKAAGLVPGGFCFVARLWAVHCVAGSGQWVSLNFGL